MSKGHAAVKFLRKVHLYLGIFTTRGLLFFAITGALQTFNMHETTQGQQLHATRVDCLVGATA
jgi:hypothetical protein